MSEHTDETLQAAAEAILPALTDAWDRIFSDLPDQADSTAAHVVAAVTPLIRAQIADEIRTEATTWEAVTAELALIANRNMPGWDAGEMATAALRTIAAKIARGDQ